MTKRFVVHLYDLMLSGHQKDIYKNIEWFGNVLTLLSSKGKKQNANLMIYYDLGFIQWYVVREEKSPNC